MMDQFFPCRYFISECFSNKVFPQWCPYINFGYPFFADPQSGLFYPVTWLVSLVHGYNVYAMNAEYMLHVLIAAGAFYCLLNGFGLSKLTCTIFAIVYSLSGIFIGNAQHLTWVISMAWMPLIILYFKKTFEDPGLYNALGLAFFCWLGLTGGYPGFFIILFYFFLTYGVTRYAMSVRTGGLQTVKTLSLSLFLAGFTFALLSSGYLYSFTESLQYIARGKPVTLIEANNIPLSPRAMISFLAPFATVCNSYFTDTDVSMANAYVGFLVIPLAFIALFKTRLSAFEKSFLVFGLICLLAAMGKYFFVRGLLYKVLPGMNMLRHASIFRVFAIMAAVLLCARGFNQMLNAIRTGIDFSVVRKMLLMYLGVLAFACVFFYLKGNGFSFPDFQTAGGLLHFNETQNVSRHILFQFLVQLLLLGIVVVVLFLKGNEKAKTMVMCMAVITDMLVASQLNIQATAISNVRVTELQAKLNKYPKGFPLPGMVPVERFSHVGDGSTLPMWYNLSFFKKTPAKDGFNSFYLQGVDDFYGTPDVNGILRRPVVFGSDSSVQIQLNTFKPGYVAVTSNGTSQTKLTLLQSSYPGWKVLQNNNPVPVFKSYSNFISCNVPAGRHEVVFVFDRPLVRGLFFFSALLALVIAVFLTANFYKTRVS